MKRVTFYGTDAPIRSKGLHCDMLANMRTRSGVTDDEESLAQLSVAALDKELARCKIRLKLASTSQLRKAFTSRIRKFERLKERQSS